MIRPPFGDDKTNNKTDPVNTSTILFFVVGGIFLLIVVALVVIILYLAHEYVLKSKNYEIMAELYRLKPLFPVQSEFGQIDKIVKILGTPNYEEWSEGYRFMENLNMKSPQCNKKNFWNLFFDNSDERIDFMEYIF